MSGKNLDEKLDVVFTTDSRYLPHAATAIASLLETNIHVVRRVFLVTFQVEAKELARVADFVGTHYGVPVILIDSPDSILDGFSPRDWLSETTNLRIFLEQLLPPDVKSFLYLDSDLIVAGNIIELVSLTRNFGTAPTQEAELLLYAAREGTPRRSLTSRGYSDAYTFNAGVMLVNLEAWRSERLSDKLVQSSLQIGPAQPGLSNNEALNYCSMGRWGELDIKFNTRWGDPRQGTIILHYSGWDKPWYLFCSDPLRVWYEQARALTPFYPYRREFNAFATRKRISRIPKNLLRALRRSTRKLNRASRHLWSRFS
jgi:UDP-glucose/galactose:(glucosyl)LPS alpha-1,2-glucosyl/galactosyltransferase